MALRTDDGLTLPEEQAEPLEIAIPFISKLTNKISLETVGIVTLTNPGK